MEVEYRTLPSFPNHRFGNDGSVWSQKNNRWGTKTEWRRLRCSRNKLGYMVTTIRRNDGDTSPKYVHRLILEAFYGPATGMQCCHCDGNPSNNRISNLRWDTPKGNAGDTLQHGTRVLGEKCRTSKLTDCQVVEIRSRRDSGELLREIAQRFGVHVSCISKICNRVQRKYAEVQQ